MSTKLLRSIRLGDDVQLTVLLAAFAFVAVGIPCVFTSTAAHTIFLQAIGPAGMPFVYIAEALLMPLVGSLCLIAELRLNLKTLALTVLAVDFVVLVGLTLGLRAGIPYVGLPAIVWFEIEAVLNGLVLWGLAGQLMTLRQGKRLFGIISAGEPAAIVIGGLLTPLLLHWLSAGDLFLVSAAGVSIGSGLVLYITSRFRLPEDGEIRHEGENDVPESGGDVAAKRSRWWLDPYILAIVALTAASQFGFCTIDNAFYLEAGQRYPAEEDLAAFLGVFQGLVGAASVVVSLAISGPLLKRFGAGAGLLVVPGLVLAISIVIIGTGLVAGIGPVVGLLLFGNKLVDQTFRYTLDRTCTITLYQPLNVVHRLRAQALMETIVEPLAAGAAGALLAVLVSWLAFSSFQLTATVVVIAVVWGALALVVHRRYVTALRGAIASRRLGGGANLLEDAEALAHLRNRLASESPGEVLYCLELLSQVPNGVTADALSLLLHHPAVAVRLDVVRRMAQLAPDALPDLLPLIDAEIDPTVRGALIEAHANLSTADIVADLTPFLDAADDEVRVAAFAGMLRHGGIAGMLVAGAQLLKALEAPSAKERRIGALILGQVGAANVWRPLLPLLDDDNEAVRLAALTTAGRIRATACFPALIRNFETAGFEQASAASLVEIGPASIAPLVELFMRPDCSERVRHNIIATLSQFGAPAIPALLSMFSGAGCKLRIMILRALGRCQYSYAPDKPNQFLPPLIDEVRSAAYALAIWRDCFDENAGVATQALLRCCEEEIWRTQESIFLLLAFNFPDFDAKGAWLNYSQADAGQRAYALEAIDTLVTSDARQLVIPLLEGETIGAKQVRSVHVAAQERLSSRERMLDCALQPDAMLLPSTRAFAVLALYENSGLTDHVMARLRNVTDRLVRETVDSLVERRAAAQETLTMKLLTVEKISVLQRINIFSGIAAEHLVELARAAAAVVLRRDEVLITEGEHGNTMFIVVNGRIRVHRSGVTIRETGSGEGVGEMAALDPGPRSASVVTIEDTLLLRIGNRDLEYVLAEDSDISRAIIQVLCQRLRTQPLSPIDGRYPAAAERKTSP